MTANEGIRTRQLEHLFMVRLQYRNGKPPVSLAGKVGEYVGSGEGTAEGSRLKGSIHWTLFEDRGERVCRLNLFGLITASDGAEIRFDAIGFFLRPDHDRPHLWRTAAGVHFDTADPHYAWLNDILGVWEGEFDMQTYRHRYDVYASLK